MLRQFGKTLFWNSKTYNDDKNYEYLKRRFWSYWRRKLLYNAPFAFNIDMVQKKPWWRASYALGHVKARQSAKFFK